jgi:hypothetical protein
MSVIHFNIDYQKWQAILVISNRTFSNLNILISKALNQNLARLFRKYKSFMGDIDSHLFKGRFFLEQIRIVTS